MAIDIELLKKEDDMLFLRDHYFQNVDKLDKLDKEDPEYKKMVEENKWIVGIAKKVLDEFNKK